MASTQGAKDRVYLFRLQILLVDGGSLVIKNIFNQNLQSQNCTLTVCLNQEKSTITRLKTQKVITQTQYDLLFPQSGQAPSIADFDITLTICLLRNLKMCGLNRKYNWKSSPQPTDLSVEADITRLREYRNEVAHISETTGIQLVDFNLKWTDIEQILLRLNSSVPQPVPNLQQMINNFKLCSLDPVAEQRLQNEIDVWRENEKGLEKNIQLLGKDVKAVIEDVHVLKKEVKVATGDNKDVKEDVKAVTEDVRIMKKDVKTVTEGVHGVKKEVIVVTGDVNVVREDVKAVTEDVYVMKKDVKAVTEDVRGVKRDVHGVKKDVRNLGQVTSKNADLLEDTRKRVDKLENQQKQEGRETREVHTYVPSGDEAYIKLKTQLRKDLVDFYRSNHSTIPLSPLIESEQTPLTEFYVSPNINTVNVERAFGGGREVRTPVKSLQDVFCDKSKICNEIYLTADAGLGKTAFCKRLALAWSEAHTPIKDDHKRFSEDELDTANNFDFLFLLFLRDSGDKCDIDDIIIHQIVQGLRHTNISKEELEILFSEESCLVILDGLDEWTHQLDTCMRGKSDIPHRKARKCTILTTSRPWKLSVLDIPSTNIDQRLELADLSQESANTLKMNFISHILCENDDNVLKQHVIKFSEAIKEKEVSDLEVIPLLLMYLLCLWCAKIELGNSRCELYRNVIELLLSRTVKKYKDIPTLAVHTQGDIPQCLSQQMYCSRFYELLISLAQLAFETLFCETKESTLVFDNSAAEKCLNGKLFNFCLQSGILTRCKIRGNLIEQEVKISFSHKTIQDFFAALYMHSATDTSTVKMKVLSQCNSVKDILEMSKVFIFLSGINVNVLSSISRELINVINEDEITQKYRTVILVSDPVKCIKALKESQNMYISCVKENPQNADLKLCLQDIFIDKNCRQKKYYKQLQQLAVQNKENIRSVRIEMEGIPHSVQEIIDFYELANLSNVDKIFYKGTFDDCYITPLLHSSVKTLSMFSYKWQDYDFISVVSTWSALVSSRFYSLDNLESLSIQWFVMSHDQLEQLFKHVSERNSLREIGLWNLHCSEHRKSCTGCRLDLSERSKLRSSTLGNIPLSELSIDVSSLEKCDVGPLPTPSLVTHFLSYLPAASKLHTFICSSLESSEDIDKMGTTLCQLVPVRHVVLLKINLDDRALPLTPHMMNIEDVRLVKVTMRASVFTKLVDAVQTLPQTVTIEMEDCEITTEEECKREKEKIKRSPCFIVTFDGITQNNQYAFRFKTIKHTP